MDVILRNTTLSWCFEN